MNQSHFFSADTLLAALLLLVLAPLAALPQYALFVVWFLPVPLCIFLVHKLRWTSLFISIALGGCLMFSGFGLTGLLFAYGIYMAAHLIADSIQNSKNPYVTIIGTTFIFVLLFLVLLARIRWQGVHFYAQLSSQLAENQASAYSLFKMDDKQAATYTKMAIDRLQLTLPGIICIISFLLSTLAFMFARILVSTVEKKPPVLLQWNLPYGVIYLYIISLSSVLFGWFQDSRFWSHTLNSTAVVTGFLIGIQGLAFAWRRLYGRNLGKLWMSLLFVAALLPYVRSAYILVGLFDSSNRIRKI